MPRRQQQAQDAPSAAPQCHVLLQGRRGSRLARFFSRWRLTRQPQAMRQAPLPPRATQSSLLLWHLAHRRRRRARNQERGGIEPRRGPREPLHEWLCCLREDDGTSPPRAQR
eukprot:Amastigsp_a6280_53.p4 type:complete len:112 gc:universal Amastigsp_a6280_53:377-712(+)